MPGRRPRRRTPNRCTRHRQITSFIYRSGEARGQPRCGCPVRPRTATHGGPPGRRRRPTLRGAPPAARRRRSRSRGPGRLGLRAGRRARGRPLDRQRSPSNTSCRAASRWSAKIAWAINPAAFDVPSVSRWPTRIRPPPGGGMSAMLAGWRSSLWREVMRAARCWSTARCAAPAGRGRRRCMPSLRQEEAGEDVPDDDPPARQLSIAGNRCRSTVPRSPAPRSGLREETCCLALRWRPWHC
jgi:hypothetical protein